MTPTEKMLVDTIGDFLSQDADGIAESDIVFWKRIMEGEGAATVGRSAWIWMGEQQRALKAKYGRDDEWDLGGFFETLFQQELSDDMYTVLGERLRKNYGK